MIPLTLKLLYKVTDIHQSPSPTPLYFSLFDMHNNNVCFFFVVPANITMAPVDVTVVSPNDATFTCVADGVPRPNITWLRPNDSMNIMEIPTMLPGILMVMEMMVDERTTMSTLQLFMVQPIFAAEFTCRATNDLRTDERIANLIVHGG